MAAERLVDDTTIANNSHLWRRIHPDWIVPDQNVGGQRVSSAAFEDSANGSPMSVLLAELVRETGRNAGHVLAGFDGYALARITAGHARGGHQGVSRNPLPDEPAHAHVFGRKTGSVKQCLRRHAEWVIPPA